VISASSPEEFAAAMDAYRFESVAVDAGALDGATLVVVGEAHGLRETPSVLYALACALDARALALEWSHEEMDEPLQALVHNGSFDLEALWRLPESAEFFCGDGRVTAGHFALLRRLRREGRLEQVIAFDRLDPDPVPAWQVRDGDMAERLLREWDRRLPLLAVAGAFHARLDLPETLAARVAAEVPGLRLAMIQHAGRPELPAAPVSLHVATATPAVVPGRRG
jgi:hypothetical protein